MIAKEQNSKFSDTEMSWWTLSLLEQTVVKVEPSPVENISVVGQFNFFPDYELIFVVLQLIMIYVNIHPLFRHLFMKNQYPKMVKENFVMNFMTLKLNISGESILDNSRQVSQWVIILFISQLIELFRSSDHAESICDDHYTCMYRVSTVQSIVYSLVLFSHLRRIANSSANNSSPNKNTYE